MKLLNTCPLLSQIKRGGFLGKNCLNARDNLRYRIKTEKCEKHRKVI
jgi:hypothetical protein